MRVADILYLSGWSALSIEEHDNRYVIQATPSSPFRQCPQCHQETLVKHGTDQQHIRDLPLHGKWVFLRVDHQRYRCTACRRTCYQPFESIDTKRLMTTRLVCYIERKTISTNRTFASIAEEIGIDPRTVRNVFDDAIAVRGRESTFETPTILGIDELHVLGAARGVMTNIAAHTLVELLENRKKSTIIHALRALSRPDQVRTVVIDLWKPYREAIQQVLPDAAIVCDKFHVLGLATAALEAFRKQVSPLLPEGQRKTLKMHDRYLFLRRFHDLSPQDLLLLETWTKNYPLLGQAYQCKEQFFEIYSQTTREQAETAYFSWAKNVPVELRPVYWPLMLTVEEWGDQIFAHFEQEHVTGGFVESANAVARVLNRMGRGYSLPMLRARLLFGWNRTPGNRSTQVNGSALMNDDKGVPVSALVATASHKLSLEVGICSASLEEYCSPATGVKSEKR